LIKKIKKLKSSLNFSYSLISGTALILAACSNQQEVPIQPINSSAGILVGTQATESPDRIINNYQQYQTLLKATKSGDTELASQFLQRLPASAMSNSLRNALLQQLGKQLNWSKFQEQYALLDRKSIDQETRCYANLGGMEHDQAFVNQLSQYSSGLSTGCNRLLEYTAKNQQISQQNGWHRVRVLLAKNQISNARNLAQALGSPLPNPLTSSAGGSMGAQEALLYQVTGKENRNKANAAYTLQQISANLTPAQIGFGWAQLGLTQAYSLNAETALNYFDRADPQQMDAEMWEWYARSALRLQRWQKLSQIIHSMSVAIVIV